MSEHTWVLENLAAYLTDGLEPAERERFEQHTADCAPCTAALADARSMDAMLTGLFIEARPGPAMEDHAIQALRTRTLDGGWRLPISGWLAVAAAAVLLLGFTGALTSQWIAAGGLPFPGRLGSRKEPDSLTALDQLAQLTRAAVVDEITKEPIRDLAESDLGPDNPLGFYPPAMKLKVKAGSIIHNRASNLSTSAAMAAASEAPPATPPPTAAAGGMMPPGGGMGMMGNLGGMMGGMPGQPMTSGGGAAAVTNGSVAQTVNPYFGSTYNLPYSYTTPAPAGQPAAPTSGPQPSRFAPSKQMTDLYVADPQKTPPAPSKKPELAALDDAVRSASGKDRGEKPAAAKGEEQAGPRKIVIRTGEIEYEVASFDAAVATITRLIKPIKSGFIATVNSDKLANGKVRGSVVVRVPPESLDGLILDLRTDLGKNGELKNQRIGSQDITKQYTDLESRLRAARAMEERLLKIIKDGKGEIKDLLAAEKELGNWRERIEQIEGELRYYGNQVALSTLTITLFEKEIAAPFGIVERERVQMGVEVEEVDQALQAAQKAVREAKGRITKSELKQPSQGQFSAILDFEVPPDAAGPLRDRIKQLGTVARLDIDRVEETEGGSGKPADGKTRRSDTRFHLHLYNLTNVAPRESVFISLAVVDVEAARKTVLARVDQAAGRVLSSNFNRAPSDQNQGDIHFEVKSAEADAVLEEIKGAGEVMRMQVTENANAQDTTRKKRGFQVQLRALGAVQARETDIVKIASADVAQGYRAVQEAVAKAKGRMLNAQLNEKDRQNITATLDFEIRRTEEAALQAALKDAGDIYTRDVTRAPDNENVVDSKVHWQLTLINQSAIPPRQTFVFGIEVRDVDQTAAAFSAMVSERRGRTVGANVSRERSGRITAKLIYDVPAAKVHELLDRLRASGSVRVQRSEEHPEVPDSPLAVARLDVTLSNETLLVPSDEGFWTNIRQGLSTSFKALSWSLMVVIIGVCVVLPWALVLWAIYRLVLRLRRKTGPAAPPA
jgi:hypothetical protein